MKDACIITAVEDFEVAFRRSSSSDVSLVLERDKLWHQLNRDGGNLSEDLVGVRCPPNIQLHVTACEDIQVCLAIKTN